MVLKVQKSCSDLAVFKVFKTLRDIKHKRFDTVDALSTAFPDVDEVPNS